MTKRIFFANFAYSILIAIISSILLTITTYTHFLEQEKETMLSQIHLASQGVSQVGEAYFHELEEKYFRFTWIDSQGDVLYDTHGESERMENHLSRKEVENALLYGFGEGKRESATIFQELSYYAIRLEDGTVLRVSGLRSTLWVFVTSILQGLVWVFVLSAVVAGLLAHYLSQSIMKPLAQLDLDHPLKNTKAYDEITPLLTQIQRQYQKNDLQMLSISQKQEEFDIITNNMVEGLILLDQHGIVISINDSASILFDIEKEQSLGKNMLMLNRSLNTQHLLEQAYQGERAEGTVSLQDQSYQMSASPILHKDTLSGVAILLINVTEKNEAEQIRREFTANVSHELKTPLHSISGCAELLSHNLVKNDDIPFFSSQIYSEAQRLIRLVDEIISLSRLDEGAEDLLHESVDLASIAKEVVKSLEDMAQEQGLSLKFYGVPCNMQGSYMLLSGLVRNLCENAIKYNRPNGSVIVYVEKEKNTISLRVEDTGIGISEQDKQLIFQRFYRVDKSRSKEIGGTGLGLSIVKHTVSLHHGKLTIESTPNVGTSIEIKFLEEKQG